jgi:hypothetical protein
MNIDPTQLAEIFAVFGPGFIAALLLVGLLVKLARDLLGPGAS